MRSEASPLTSNNLYHWIEVKNNRAQRDEKQTRIRTIRLAEDCWRLVHGPCNPIASFHGVLAQEAYPQHLTPSSTVLRDGNQAKATQGADGKVSLLCIIISL